MPTVRELDLSLELLELAGLLLLLPSTPAISVLLVLILQYIDGLRHERRWREYVPYLGRVALVDPYESPAMRVIKYGDDRAMKKFISVSRGLFELVLVDFGTLLARRERGTRGRPYSLDKAMVLALALFYMASSGGCVWKECVRLCITFTFSRLGLLFQIQDLPTHVRDHSIHAIPRFGDRAHHAAVDAAVSRSWVGAYRLASSRGAGGGG
jgi:hypothetical protein